VDHSCRKTHVGRDLFGFCSLKIFSRVPEIGENRP
jgi:hypothetical protein